MKRITRRLAEWIGFFLWAVFVNACNSWIITPLVEDYAILGVAVVFVIVALWLTSIPAAVRKQWISFTVFSLLLGDGLSSISFHSTKAIIELGAVMCIGLIVVARWYGKVRVATLALTTVGLILCNVMLPFSEWPFLTHFWIAYYGRESVVPSDLPALPLVVVPSGNGNAIITVKLAKETKQDVAQVVANAGAYLDDLKNVLRSFKHRYTFVELTQHDGRFVQAPVAPQDLAAVNPNQLVSALFPFSRAYWSVDPDGQVIQYMAQTASPREWMQFVTDSANYPTNVIGMAQAAEHAELADWQKLLDSLGVSAPARQLTIRDGRLVGEYQGRAIDVPVSATEILAFGAFTAPNAHQVLLEGANELQVVSLDSGTGTVVSTFHGNADAPLPNDIKTGPIDNSGQDAIFVNSTPAVILRATEDSQWQTLYTAPNESLRFEGSVRFPGDKTPEIITNDPSYMRDAPTRYFSSYTYRNGQLERNWRIYHTNMVNVRVLQFEPGGPEYIVAAIYATGKFLVLQRHGLPVMSVTITLLALVIVLGWVLRLRSRGRTAHA